MCTKLQATTVLKIISLRLCLYQFQNFGRNPERKRPFEKLEYRSGYNNKGNIKATGYEGGN